MGNLDGLEKQLNEVFVKNAPFQLPEDFKKWIVTYLPYINLFIGVLSVWSAVVLYRWATVANRLLDYANQAARTYGVDNYVQSSRLTFMIWISLGLLAAQGVLWIVSFNSVKAKKKSGWNLLFIALLVGAVYGLISLFNGYSGGTNFVSYIVGTLVGLYVLFQIRSSYLPVKKDITPKKK